MNEQIPWTLLDGGSTVAVKQSELILTWPCGTRMKTSLDQASTNVSWISSHSMRWTLSESSLIWRARIVIHFPRPCFCTKLCDTWSEPGSTMATMMDSQILQHLIFIWTAENGLRLIQLQEVGPFITRLCTVCLVQTGDGGVPFISTLEFMPLPDVLYPHLDPNISFSLLWRANLGGGEVRHVVFLLFIFLFLVQRDK